MTSRYDAKNLRGSGLRRRPGRRRAILSAPLRAESQPSVGYIFNFNVAQTSSSVTTDRPRVWDVSNRRDFEKRAQSDDPFGVS